MIKTLEVQNYKSFANKTKIDLTNLNIVTGVNSSGKSSILEAILLMAQRNERDILNGSLISVGSFQSIRNNQTTDKHISIEIVTKSGENVSMQLMDNVPVSTKNDGDETLINEQNVLFLSAERIGVKDLYDKSNKYEIFDPQGNYLISLLAENASNFELGKKYLELFPKSFSQREFYVDLPLFEPKTSAENEEKYNRGNSLLDVINTWMELLTGYIVECKGVEDTNYIKLTYLKDNDPSKSYKPQHVGTGVTFVLFQLIAVFLAPEDSIVLVENPEIHLHPKLQADLAYFYMWATRANKQILLETHSDHIFNSFRLFKSRKEECSIFFVSNNDNEDSSKGTTSIVEEIKIGTYGEIINDREGLFDQFCIDLERMTEPWHERKH